jgi:phosphate transport system substrate-binding protein
MNKMPMQIKGIAGVLFVCVLLCGLVLPGVALAAPTAATIHLAGSTTVNPIVNASINPYHTLVDTNTTIVIDSALGSGDGLGKLLRGTTDIAMSSRDIKISDGNPTTPYTVTDVLKTIVAKDALCIIVNKARTNVTKITKAQLVSIYGGGGLTWNDLGDTGNNAPVVPRARTTDSGTRSSFLDFTGVTASQETAVIDGTGKPARLPGNPEMVSAIATNPGQIGYVGLGFVSADPNIKAIEVDFGAGPVAPSPETVVALTYPMSRPLYLMRINDTAKPGQPAEFQEYMNWMAGNGKASGSEIDRRGQDLPIREGFVANQRPESDVNADGSVDVGDVVKIGLAWGDTVTPGGSKAWDVNFDTSIDVGDVVVVGLSWNALWKLPA